MFGLHWKHITFASAFFWLDPVHCSQDPQVLNSVNFTLKLGPTTLYTFKNYFTIMFSAISSIQTLKIQKIVNLDSRYMRNSDMMQSDNYAMMVDKHREANWVNVQTVSNISFIVVLKYMRRWDCVDQFWCQAIW